MKKLKDINWNHLYCFYEVAKTQSLKKGAASVGSAPSTISEQIRKLEEQFEKKFFNRSSRSLSLTPEGQMLFERVRPIFEEGNKLLDQFSDDVFGGYPVTIGIEESMSHDLASEFCSQYWDMYTSYGTVNTVRQADHDLLVDSLLSGHIDWGISLRKPKRKSLCYEVIGAFEISFCCSAELYEKFINKKDILKNIPFVESSRDVNLNKYIASYLRKNGIVPKEKICSDHISYIRRLCDRGRCVMFLPKNPLDDYAGLKTFQFENPLTISLYAIWKKSDEGLVSIKKLKELIHSKLSQVPERYEDVDLQIEASEVSDDLLK